MKTVIEMSGTSPRIDFYINEFHQTPVGGLLQVETISPRELQVKSDLVYQITKALLRNVAREVFTEPHDLVAVKEWFAEIFGDRWNPEGFANKEYPQVFDLAHSKERVRDMANRLLLVQSYQKLLNDSIALTGKGSGEQFDHYPGLLTVAYMGAPREDSAEQHDGLVRHSLRLIKEIPREMLECLHDLFGDESIPRETVGTPPVARHRTLLAHRVPNTHVSANDASPENEEVDERIPAHVSNENTSPMRLIEGGRPSQPVQMQYAQDFDSMDFSELNPRDKALVAAAVRRFTTLTSQDALARMFRPRQAMRQQPYGRPMDNRNRPPYGAPHQSRLQERRP